MDIQEEQIVWPFFVINPDGSEFRDALVFQNAEEFRNTSQSEREEMQNERYQNWLIAITPPPDDGDNTGDN